MAHPTLRRIGTLLLIASTPLLHAQDPCDDVEVTLLRYGAFSDTMLRLDVMNNGDFFFNYPMFGIIDQTGDTIARTVNFSFGMANGAHGEQLEMNEGLALPQSPFTGSVLLQWALDPEPTNSCLLEVTNIELCPPAPCAPLSVMMFNFSSEPQDAGFTWYITDTNGSTVSDGGLFLSANGSGTVMQNICLPPGAYVLHMAQPFSAPGNFVFGLGNESFLESGPTTPFVPNGNPSVTTDLPFTFYPACAEMGNNISEPTGSAFQLAQDGRTLIVRSTGGSPLGALQVLDASGKLVRTFATTNDSILLDLTTEATGLYFLRSLDRASTASVLRFVLP